jgi:hypothetical protein
MKYPIYGCRRPTGKAFKELEEASYSNIPIIEGDIQELINRIKANNKDATSVRALIRACFSLIEAIAYFWKQETLLLSEREASKVVFSQKEIDILKGRKIEIKKKKRVEVLIRQNFLDRLKTTYRMYSKLWGFKYCIDPNHPGWQDMAKASQIRDRITHPAKPRDVMVSNEEYQVVHRALQWFVDQQNEIDRLKKEKWAKLGSH